MYRDEQWTPVQNPHTSATSWEIYKQSVSPWRRNPALYPSNPWEDNTRHNGMSLDCQFVFKLMFSPAHWISVNLQEPEHILGFLSIFDLLFSCERVVRHEQGMSATCRYRSSHNMSTHDLWPLKHHILYVNLTFGSEVALLLLGPDVVIVFSQNFYHRLKTHNTRTSPTLNRFDYRSTDLLRVILSSIISSSQLNTNLFL